MWHRRGCTLIKLANNLSDGIVKDWKLGKVDTEDPNFQDLIFTLPVSFIACGKFISKEVEMLTAKEVEAGKERK